MPSKKAEIIGMPWDFASLFNQIITSLPERAMIKRDYIWASEIGGDYCSRYLKMFAHPYSNPPTDRAKQKFVSGHIFEWIVMVILTLSGILKAKQLRGEVQLHGLLKVSGKLDFVAGGVVDWEKAKNDVKEIQKVFAISVSEMPPIIFHAIEKIMLRMENMFSRVPLEEVILECKSIGSMMAKRMEVKPAAMPHHELQNLHYLLANKMPTGMLLYISKDDSFCYQYEVKPTKDLLKRYRDDVAQMTEYYRGSGKNYLKNLPPKAPEIQFIEQTYTFVKNFHVEYNSYLTMLYGYKNLDEFKDKWDKTIVGWNRVFKRHVNEGMKLKRGVLTLNPANLEIIKEAKKIFPLWDKYVLKARKDGVFQKAEVEDGEV